MSKHWEVKDEHSNFSNTCTCGWKSYGARDRIEGWQDLRRHIDDEQAKERAAAAAEKERIRLLSEGQNWDLP